MSKSKHTQGPYRVIEDKGTLYITAYNNEVTLCQITQDEGAEDAALADALLLASAPDLLHLAEMMLERLEDENMIKLWESPEEHEIEMDIYRKIIAEAKGES